MLDLYNSTCKISINHINIETNITQLVIRNKNNPNKFVINNFLKSKECLEFGIIDKGYTFRVGIFTIILAHQALTGSTCFDFDLESMSYGLGIVPHTSKKLEIN